MAQAGKMSVAGISETLKSSASGEECNDNGEDSFAAEQGDAIVIDKKAERRLLRKFDLHILPLLVMMYLFNSLDKSNLGNAKTAGLEKDLGIAGTDKCE